MYRIRTTRNCVKAIFTPKSHSFSNQNPFIKPTNNAKSQSSGFNPMQAMTSPWMIKLSIFGAIVELSVGVVLYKMNEDPSFNATLKSYTSESIYGTLDSLRLYSVAVGVLSDNSIVAKPVKEAPVKTTQQVPVKTEVQTPPPAAKVNESDAKKAKIPQTKNETPKIEEASKAKGSDSKDDKSKAVSKTVEEPKAKVAEVKSKETSKETKAVETKAVVEDKPKAKITENDVKPPAEEESKPVTAPSPVLATNQVEQTKAVDKKLEEASKQIMENAQTKVEEGVIPLLPVEMTAKALTTETTDAMIHELTVKSIALRKEFEETLFKDLKSMDEQTLRYKYTQLASDYFERNKWEGVRLQQALKQLESEVSRKYLELMQIQRQEFEHIANSTIKKKEEELKSFTEAEAEVLNKKYQSEVEKLSQDLKTQYENSLKAEIEKETSKLQTELEEKFALEIAQQRESFMKSQLELQNSVEDVRSKLITFHKLVDEASTVKAVSADIHKASAAALALENALSTGQPVASYVDSLLSVSGSDPLLQAISNSVPATVKKSGSLTIPELKLRFSVVRNEARKAALAPESMPTFVGQIFGSALAAISWSPKGYVLGEGVEETLARTEFLLEQGKLQAALNEADTIKGYAGELLEDWKELLRHRLVADQTATILRSDAILKFRNYPSIKE